MQRNLVFNIYKKGELMYFDYMEFDGDALSLIKYDTFSISLQGNFEDKVNQQFTQIISEYVSKGIDESTFHWSATIGRFQNTSSESKVIIEILKKVVLEFHLRRSADKLLRRNTQKPPAAKVLNKFMEEKDLFDTNKLKFIDKRGQRLLWVIALALTSGNFENKIKKYK